MTDELLSRGVERIYPNREGLERELASGRKLKIYLGIDPTGPTLHIGHGVNLLKLRELQDAGHEVILLMGDFTAQIGDPTGKSATRREQTPAEVMDNMKAYQEQVGRVLDLSRVKILYNSDWLSKLGLAEVIKLASEFTVGQMIERDMFQERMKKGEPIHLHEFLYPLLQGYDSVAMGVDLEIGGNDQTFNMLAGRSMMKRRGREKFVLTTKLLVDPAGKKMGKTEGNMVSLADKPTEAYGKVMSWPDSLMSLAFELCTRIPLDQALELIKTNPYEAKKNLAFEIVKTFFSEEAAKGAQESFAIAFQKREVPEDIPEQEVVLGIKLADALMQAGMVKSKSEFRRLLEEGAIRLVESGDPVQDAEVLVTATSAWRIGKHRFIKLVAR